MSNAGDTFIRAIGLGKRYRLGASVEMYGSFREALMSIPRALFGSRGVSGDPDEREFWALRDVSFEVRRGDVVGIIGRNGAGKSTLLKILSRITDPSEGECFIHGRLASLLEVGTGFHPELSGRENVYLNGSILGMSKREIDSKFDEIVAFSEVEKFLDTPVKRYSSGMYVRLAFSVAAHLDPEILVIDEVLAVGDTAFQEKCLGKMNDVARAGRTVLFVSHNMHAVRRLCSRAILLDSGRIMMDDEQDTVTDHYLRHVSKVTRRGEVYVKDWNGNAKRPGTFRTTCVRTLNAAGEVTTSFSIHEALTIEVDLENIGRNGFSVSFSIQNLEGIFVYHLRSQDSDIQFHTDNGAACVRATIPSLDVVEGQYTVNVWLGNHFKVMEERLEAVVAFDVYNQGHSKEKLGAIVHQTGRWELDVSDAAVEGRPC